MKHFIYNVCIFSLPFILLLAPYFIKDPFKVLYHYDTFYPIDEENCFIDVNRSTVSTRLYVQNNDIYHYDSYIFGNSKSGVYCINDWKQYIPSGASCFHFDGAGEPLYNVYHKIKFINDHSSIKNALIPIDRQMLSLCEPINYDHLRVLDPIILPSNFFTFHIAYIKAFLTTKFYLTYIDFIIGGEAKQYMFDNQILEKRTFEKYNIQYNEMGNGHRDVIKLSDDSYGDRLSWFYTRPDTLTYLEPLIGTTQKQMLTEIKNIFEESGTNYMFIIDPSYDQCKFDQQDSIFLDSLFHDRLIDMSGINIITEDYHNYSDPYHYTSYIANEIIKIAYEKDKKRQRYMLDSLYNTQQ